MSSISAETSQKIKNMSVICAMLVVMIHITWSEDVVCLTWFINEFVREGIARIAVPFFFVISGFFLAVHFDEEKWWSCETKKRIRSLVVPYFVWCLLTFLATSPLNILSDLIAHRPFGTSLPLSNGRWINLLGLNLDRAPLVVPLWYIRCLFFFVLLSPLFKAGVSKLRVAWLLLAFVSLVATKAFAGLFYAPGGRPFWTGFLEYGFSLSGVFYFSVGIYLRRFHIAVHSRPLAVVCAVFGIGYLFVRTFARMHGMKIPYSTGCLFLPTLMYATWHVMPSKTFPVWLTSCSFPIFLLHMIFLDYIQTFFKYCSIGRQLGALVSCAVAIVASIVLTNLLRKRFPRLADFLFAGRA